MGAAKLITDENNCFIIKLYVWLDQGPKYMNESFSILVVTKRMKMSIHTFIQTQIYISISNLNLLTKSSHNNSTLQSSIQHL